MNLGMLWQCDSKDYVKEISSAQERYIQKYGKIPDTCFFNTSLNGILDSKKNVGMNIKFSPYIQVGNLWMGVDAEK